MHNRYGTNIQDILRTPETQQQQNKQPYIEMGGENEETFFKGQFQVAKKHDKKCSDFLAIRKMQIKITLRFHLFLLRPAYIQRSTNKQTYFTAGGRVDQSSQCGVFTQLKTDILYHPAIPFLGIYPKAISTYEKITCIPTFTATQSIIAKSWN